MSRPPGIRNIAFIGGHVPRQCGIATFTSDLRGAIAREFPEAACRVAAMTDRQQVYDYPEHVAYEIHQEDQAAYRQAADFLNLNGVEILSVQHEFGIYGGDCGVHLLDLLREVNMPVVTTLHTILSEPSTMQRQVMLGLNQLSDRFVVMAEHGKTLLHQTFDISPARIDVIPHGVIDVPFLDPEFNKEQFGIIGRTVMLTFGLLSPNKGIEQAIQALPEVIQKHPDIIYVIAGVTHPHLRAHEGEAYREMLEQMITDLGLEDHVKFENRFMTLAELTALIEASDIYVTPYLNASQITSGALSYAFGAGKAIVSTPYWHASELLADDRGLLVPFSDPSAIAGAVNRYLENPALMTAVRKRAYELGRSMTWPHAARAYMATFSKARVEHGRIHLGTASAGPGDPPPLNFSHLVKMTGPLGIFQHAVHNIPNNAEGYCTDDNARAYLLTLLAEDLPTDAPGRAEFCQLSTSYLAFLWDAFEPRLRRFRNFMSRGLEWMELEGSEDSHARAMWAVGTGVSRSTDPGHRSVCAMLFHRGMKQLGKSSSPRSWAFGLLGLNAYLSRCPGDRGAGRLRLKLSNDLVNLHRGTATGDWPWFESILSYDNARLPQALIQSGLAMNCEDILSLGLKTLQWLLKIQKSEQGWLSPIGCHGFWRRGGERARFDQQSLEAGALVSACLEAHRAQPDSNWLDEALNCTAWYTGHNDLGLEPYDPITGGCHDALLADHMNENQGAESTLACHMALVETRLAKPAPSKVREPCPV